MCPFVSSRYLDRIIRGPELHEFATMLMPHQKATTADGWSYLSVIKLAENTMPSENQSYLARQKANLSGK